jgi:hypothetical protein
MSAAKHTPGPWRAGEVRHAGTYQLVESDGLARGFVCEVQAHDGADLGATVALIAAAPALLDSVAALLPYAESRAEDLNDIVEEIVAGKRDDLLHTAQADRDKAWAAVEEAKAQLRAAGRLP